MRAFILFLLPMIFILNHGISQIIDLNAGLVAYYPFNGNARDATGNGHHGVVTNGAVLATDRFGNANSAYHFDGVDDYIEVNDNGGLANSHISLAVWFKTASTDLQTVIGKENFNTATGAVFQIAINWGPEPGVLFNLMGDNQPPCDQYNNTSTYISGGPMPFAINQWHCLVATFDGQVQKLYVDGNLLGIAYPPDFEKIRPCNTPIRFGGWYNGLQPFKGEMDEIRIYNRALNEAEVLSLCPSGTSSLDAGFTHKLNCGNEVVFKDITKLTVPATPSWYWEFGDGGSSVEQHPVHTYPRPGIYRVKLEITNMGEKIRITNEIIIPEVTTPVTAGNDTTVCGDVPITLKGGGGGTYAWAPAAGLDDPSKAEPTVKLKQDTRFTLTVTKANGCVEQASVMINVRTSPAVALQDKTICNLDTLQLSAAGGTQYHWTPAIGLDNAAVADPRAYPSVSTRYHVEFKDAFACIYKDEILLTVKPTPLVAVAQDKFNICEGDSVKLDLATYVTGGQLYTWTPATGLSNATGNSAKASPLNSTRYIVDISNAEGCHNYDTLQVNVLPLPVLSLLSKEMIICVKDTVQLRVSGGISYNWSPAAFIEDTDVPDPRVYPNKDTFFVVTARGANNCARKDSVKVIVKEHAVFSLSPLQATLCEGGEVALTVSGGDKYIWDNTPGLSDYSSGKVIARPGGSSTYKVQAIGSVCRDTVEMQTAVTVHPLPAVHVVSNIKEINCAAPTAQLAASGALSYSWSPGKWLSDSTIATPIAGPAEAITYLVSGKDINGCINSATIYLDFNKIGENTFTLPTAFSPNGDGTNDCFGIARLGNVLQKGELRVFNRWGDLLFRSTSSIKCWDGTFKGHPVDIGTYVYYLSGETICGPIMRKGTVTIIR